MDRKVEGEVGSICISTMSLPEKEILEGWIRPEFNEPRSYRQKFQDKQTVYIWLLFA